MLLLPMNLFLRLFKSMAERTVTQVVKKCSETRFQSTLGVLFARLPFY